MEDMVNCDSVVQFVMLILFQFFCTFII